MKQGGISEFCHSFLTLAGDPNWYLNILNKLQKQVLMVASATFLLLCFVKLKESTCKARKNVFYFTSKALFVLDKIKIEFQLFKFHGQFMSYQKRNVFSKKFQNNCDLKTSSGPFCICKEVSTNLIMENNIFKATCLKYQICNTTTIQICQNYHVYLLRFLYTEDSLKIKKGLELVSRPHFSYNFLIKSFVQYTAALNPY